jgi:hypothetical protein
METVMKIAKDVCPMPFHRFSCIVSDRTGLSLRKLTDDYLEVLIQVGRLKKDGNTIDIGECK